MHTVRYGEKEMRLIESGALDEQAPLLAGKDLDVKKAFFWRSTAISILGLATPYPTNRRSSRCLKKSFGTT